MLSVSLTISDNQKASKLLDLLKELPFVEITGCQEVSPQDLAVLTGIFERHLAQREQGGSVIDVRSQASLSVDHAIYQSVFTEYGSEQLMPLFTQIATNPKPTDVVEFQVGERKAYCRFCNGFRVLYQLGSVVYTGQQSISVFHVLKLS
ncbi:hypothetical protein HHL22_11900 [Hymenobacter sp. RP-2-7]|uniref:Uncharacterized protein n=1 Tax=Hymenobacter polaris TaxID=2682546 RepID=A0A7Y0FMY6_9BACT|nr:hypothetical protein [Hymenobacter polaris]NML65909.1 hypothetical protein [Hymenobacter polaris]